MYDFDKDIRKAVIVNLAPGVSKQSVIIFLLHVMEFEIPGGEEYN